MGLYERNVVDAIGIDKAEGHVTLAIIDGEDWVNEEHHLLLFQDKLNSYLSFIESGEILTVYKDAQRRAIEITIHFKYEIPKSCLDCLERVNEMTEAGFIFNYHIG